MNHKEILKVIHTDLKNSGITNKVEESNKIFQIVIDALADTLVKGHNIDIMNFGTLSLYMKKMRDMSKEDKPEIKRWCVSFSSSRNFLLRLNADLKNESKK